MGIDVWPSHEKHCGAVIKDATKLRHDLLEFARWHQMQAAELKGK